MKNLFYALMALSVLSCSNPTDPASVAVTGISLDQTSLTLSMGGNSFQLTATVAPSDASDQNITWSSSDSAVASVDSGQVTPVGEGSATITVATEDGSKTATCAVMVTSAQDVMAPLEVSSFTATTPLTGQVILTWTDPSDSDLSSVVISASGLSDRTVSPGVQKTVINDLTVGTALTFTIKTVDSSGNMSGGTTRTVTPEKVVYRVRNYYSTSSTWYLVHTKTTIYDTWDCIMINFAESSNSAFPANYNWIAWPGFADPTDEDLVTFESESYPGYYLRIDSANHTTYPTNQGQWYGWSLGSVSGSRNYIAWANEDDGTTTFDADATFRIVDANNGVGGCNSLQWYQDSDRYLSTGYYHVFAYTSSDVTDAYFNRDSSWTLIKQ